MAKAIETLNFDLANALSRDPIELSDFFGGHFSVAPDTKAHPDYIRLTFRQFSQSVRDDPFRLPLIEHICVILVWE
jgi:hypothetical protein